MKSSKKTKTRFRGPSNHVKKSLNFWIYFFAISTPLFELTQAVKIFAEKSSSDVSLFTWLYFLVDNIVWLLYGYYYKQKPILIMYALYTISELIVIGMILFYR
jgi:uncharacterized protein with PQ loop repeat